MANMVKSNAVFSPAAPPTVNKIEHSLCTSSCPSIGDFSLDLAVSLACCFPLLAPHPDLGWVLQLKVSASSMWLWCPECRSAEIPKWRGPELNKCICAHGPLLGQHAPWGKCSEGKFTFLGTFSSRLPLQTLQYRNPFGLEASSLAVELFWRRPGINDFSDSVGNGNDSGVRG